MRCLCRFASIDCLLIREATPNILAELVAANGHGAQRHWMIRFPELAAVEAIFSPAATLAEALAAFPGAVAAESVPEIPRQPVTSEGAAELHELVAMIFPGADAAERADVLRVALANVEAALTSFGALVADLTPPPDRRD